jgi:hypothetical protein
MVITVVSQHPHFVPKKQSAWWTCLLSLPPLEIRHQLQTITVTGE